jgi:hypothetical protein
MKLTRNWQQLWKSYSVIFSFANILQAVSMAGLSVLGVINIYLAFRLVIGLAVLFGVLGMIGRLLSQPKLKPTEVSNG